MFESLEHCLSWGEFDASVVMVPHYLHESFASTLLAAGKHVLLEKPLAHSVASCRRLLEVAERSEPVLMIGENSAYWPEVSRAARMYMHGDLLDLTAMYIHTI